MAVLHAASDVQLDLGVVDAALALLLPFRDEAADAARGACSALESTHASHNATLTELEPIQALEVRSSHRSSRTPERRQCEATARGDSARRQREPTACGDSVRRQREATA